MGFQFSLAGQAHLPYSAAGKDNIDTSKHNKEEVGCNKDNVGVPVDCVQKGEGVGVHVV
jgi:hypothetical protein